MTPRFPHRVFTAFGIAASLAGLAIPQASSAASFTDVKPGDFSYDAVEYLKERKIISGYSDGTFRPDSRVNRAEALKIIVTPFLSDAEAATYKTTPFKDVPGDAWYIPVLGWAIKQGSIIGVPPAATSFFGGRDVTKAEFLKMFLAARKIDPKSFSDIAIPLAKDVTDPKQWYYPYLRYAIASSMTTASSDNKYSPTRELTRGDVAVLMHRFFEYRAGDRTQALLSEAAREDENVINALSRADSREADYASARAVLISRGAHEIAPNETVVKVSVKISEGYRALVRAYKAGLAGDLKTVVKLSSDAWYLGEQAKKLSTSATDLATQLQTYASSFAKEARAHMN